MKKLVTVLLVGLLAFALAACGNKDKKEDKADNSNKQEQQLKDMQKKLNAQKVDENKVVAVVNGKELVGKDYNRALSSAQLQMQQTGQDPTSKEGEKAIKKQTLDNLVNNSVVLQEAEKKGFKPTAKEVSSEFDTTKKPYKTDQQFKDALKKAHLTEDQLKKQITDGLTIKKYIKKEIPTEKVSDQELKDFYDKNVKNSGDKKQKAPAFDKVKPQIKQQIEQEKQQKQIMKRVDELKKNAKIDLKM
ncbi:putative lipoprotein [Fictibacillus macauensis ZFHKF-1]|uniref:peptidylprolyl isomerase n=1 Tax=Fictibacillus macauensis ZFHKF-1 TaxID=1196324 RepID=I8J409_9BACL|nr:SurA N-terminal domain-containing protein [Fictibacillus macauensis]EIT86496.1 putative lipoprotein [Fictibacillus macauensis ZFHKF-1]